MIAQSLGEGTAATLRFNLNDAGEVVGVRAFQYLVKGKYWVGEVKRV